MSRARHRGILKEAGWCDGERMLPCRNNAVSEGMPPPRLGPREGTVDLGDRMQYALLTPRHGRVGLDCSRSQSWRSSSRPLTDSIFASVGCSRLRAPAGGDSDRHGLHFAAHLMKWIVFCSWKQSALRVLFVG
jgi:hypothetical protein